MAASGPRSSGLSRRVSPRAAWIYKYCKDAPCTYFRAVEIAYRFAEASGRGEDDPDVFLAATIIASKIENEMSVPFCDVHKMRPVKDGAYFYSLELTVLNKLDFNVAFTTAYQFLRLYLDAGDMWSDPRVAADATYALAVASFIPGTFMSTDPSLAAAAALSTALPMHMYLSPGGDRVRLRDVVPHRTCAVRSAKHHCADDLKSVPVVVMKSAVEPIADVWSRYDRHVRIGRGSYGCVYKATDRDSGRSVAVKRAALFAEDVTNFGFEESVLSELAMLRLLPDHDNIVSVIECFAMYDGGSLRAHHVMPIADCNLYTYCNERFPISQCEIKRMTAQILRGLCCIHAHGIVHGDVKTHNILVFGETVKIADFGTSCSYIQDRDLRGDCTVHTRSPESLLGSAVRSWPVDMWAVGCVTAEMALGKILMWSKDEAELDVWRNIVSIAGTPSEMDWPEIRDTKRWKVVREESQGILKVDLHKHSCISADHAAFIDELLVYNPDRRISAAHALNHQFLRE